MNILWAIIKRDVMLAFFRRGGAWHQFAFFMIVLALFPLGIGPKPETLTTISPSILWITALLMSTLSLPSLFEHDYDDGNLEQYFLLPCIPSLIVLAKIISHWLSSGLPLVIISPILAIMMGMANEQLFLIALTLLVGTPILTAIGAMSAALALGLRRSGVLASLLVLPLYVPILIFGAGAFNTLDNWHYPLLLLLAILLFTLPLAIILSTYALKVAFDS